MEKREFKKVNKTYLFIKRLFDIISSFFGILLLSPLLIICSILIKVTSRGPIFFKQDRIGKNKKIFKILKFRTMKIDAPHDAPTHKLKDTNLYITKVGRFLRKTSLDELPQLFNIFSGKMSVIGPRPALWNQNDLIEERDKYHANSIKPGLTGWAQIHGRDELEIPVKAKLDGYYTEHLSFKLDVKCFFLTIISVFKSEGVVEGGTGAIEDKKEESENEKQ